MTYREAFIAGLRRLTSAPVPTETPDLDARVLLTHAAGLNHAGLLARWPDQVAPGVIEAFEASLARREAGEPVAWISGVKEFLGMDFEVGPGLLVPRADTETLVEAALEAMAGRTAVRAVDVCTGTGCVAVGLAALAPIPWRMAAGDVSPVAIETAQRNAHRLLTEGRAVSVVASDLMQGLPGPYDLIVSNPPYLTPEETQQRVGPGGWKEPGLALDGGGPDGLDLIRRLVAEAAERLAPGGWLLIEAADAQADTILGLMAGAGLAEGRTWRDLGGQRRVTGARLTW